MAFGVTLPTTPWWRNLTTTLPPEVTTERPGRTFALVEMLVRVPWRRQQMSVLNAGISGNELFADTGTNGQSALNRFLRDVVEQTGVRAVIIWEGANDILSDSGLPLSDFTSDFLIAREGLQGNIDRYLSGGASPTDPLVNPLYADFTGFPRLFVTASDTESLFADAERLDRIARRDGVDVTFSVAHGQQHVWPLQAGTLPAADAAIAEIAAWYRAGRPGRPAAEPTFTTSN